MTDKNIKPDKITRPIQLLGAWLAGLLSVDSCFLFAASNMSQGTFESYALVVAAILNVPIFLAAVFILQTKFRPELQEDSYYSTYLNQKTNKQVTISKSDAHILELAEKLQSIEKRIKSNNDSAAQEANLISSLNIGINSSLSNIDEIKTKLKEAGATSYTSFGTGELPQHKSIAITHGLSGSTQKELIKLAKEIGFSHYSNYSKYEEDIAEDVLIGGYGKPGHKIL